MKHTYHILAVIVTFALFGCGRSGSQGTAGFEGTYVETDNPDISLVVKGDRWRQGASDIYVDCTFIATKTSDTTYDVELTYQNSIGNVDLRGQKKTVILRKEGNYVVVKDGSDETRFMKK